MLPQVSRRAVVATTDAAARTEVSRGQRADAGEHEPRRMGARRLDAEQPLRVLGAIDVVAIAEWVVPRRSERGPVVGAEKDDTRYGADRIARERVPAEPRGIRGERDHDRG